MKKWREVLFLLVLMTGVTAAATAVAGQDMAVWKNDSRRLPIYCVDREDKVLAISFDAAWGDAHTRAILDILDEYGVKTTFFLVDFWAEKYPEDLKEIAARGHEVGNHSSTHPDMTGLTAEQIRRELETAGQRIESITGVRPTLFRPPFGAYNNTLIEVCESCGYQAVQWSVDSLDWKDVTAEQVAERVIRNVKCGSIVLFHNNAEQVESYLPMVLKALKDQGYSIVPVGELIFRGDFTIDHTGRQLSGTGGNGSGNGEERDGNRI